MPPKLLHPHPAPALPSPRDFARQASCTRFSGEMTQTGRHRRPRHHLLERRISREGFQTKTGGARRAPGVAPNQRTRDTLGRLTLKTTLVSFAADSHWSSSLPVVGANRRVRDCLYVRYKFCTAGRAAVSPGRGRPLHRNDTRILRPSPPPPEPLDLGTMPQPVNARLPWLRNDAGR